MVKDIKRFIGIIFTSAIIMGFLYIGVHFFENKKPLDSNIKLATPISKDNSLKATSTESIKINK
ncbi:MAG: hypothetical protein WCF92_03820 [bacterium]